MKLEEKKQKNHDETKNKKDYEMEQAITFTVSNKYWEITKRETKQKKEPEFRVLWLAGGASD